MFTLGTSALIMQGLGVLTSAFGSYDSAKAQKESLKSQAALADLSAKSFELSAQSSILAGQKEVARQTLKAGQIKSSQRAAMAANGIDLGVGSAVEVQASTDLMKEIDKNQIEANALNQAFGYRTQAVNATNSALLKRASASSISPGAAAFSSLLAGAGRVASNWYQLDKLGAFNSSSGSINYDKMGMLGDAPMAGNW